MARTQARAFLALVCCTLWSDNHDPFMPLLGLMFGEIGAVNQCGQMEQLDKSIF
jgi:hypothetical protein